MTFAEIYAEIVTRSGEGYDNYLDRAEVMFWKAVSTIINQSGFDLNEIRGMSIRYTKELTRDDFVNGRYNLMRIWSDQAIPDEALTPFFTQEIFRYALELTPLSPEMMRFTQVNMKTIRESHILSTLSEAAGVSELIWSFDYPDLRISTLAKPYPFRCYASLATYGIPREAKEDGTTEADGYMSADFLSRSIEMAVSLLKTETE